MKIKKKQTRLKPESFPELRETAGLIGEFIQYWGFKKVHGRIWAYLFLMKTPLSTRHLCELLKISNSLVSISVAELMKYGVISEAGKGPNGVLLYQANPDVGSVIAGVLRNREQKLLRLIQSSAENLPPRSPSPVGSEVRMDAARIKQLAEWVVIANGFLESGIAFVEATL
jgi:DNA-binding transcriptional regulator GbsR (MarR family)